MLIKRKKSGKWISGEGCDGSKCNRCERYLKDGTYSIWNYSDKSTCANFGSSHCKTWKVQQIWEIVEVTEKIIASYEVIK